MAHLVIRIGVDKNRDGTIDGNYTKASFRIKDEFAPYLKDAILIADARDGEAGNAKIDIDTEAKLPAITVFGKDFGSKVIPLEVELSVE